MRNSTQQIIAGSILLLYTLLAVNFARGPILEGPNEVEHYRFIRHIANETSLPDRAGFPYGQLHQAPLYYMIGALFASPADDGSFEEMSNRLNPWHSYAFEVPGSDNKNVYLHYEGDEDTGVAQNIRLLRLYSIGLGLLTVAVGFATLRLLFRNHPHMIWIGLAIVAFTPQFVYMTSVVNNDNLLFLTVAVSLYLVLRQYIYGPSYPLAIGLGVALGAALLSKSSAAMLVFPMALAVLIDRRTWFWYAPVTLGVTVLVAGWWYIGNLTTYGDPTGIQAMFQTWPTEVIREGEIAWDIGLDRAPYGYQSFWGRFGHGSVALGQSVYIFFDVVTAIGAFGALWVASRFIYRWQQTKNFNTLRLGLIVAAFTLVWVVALVYSASIVQSGNQGRYLMPGFVGWAVLIAVGFNVFLPDRLKLRAALTFLALMPIVLLYVQETYFFPAYQVEEAPNPNAEPIYTYDNTAELIGVEPDTIYGAPGDIVPITLTWRVRETPSQTLLTYVHSLGSDVVRRDTHPGTGNFPSANWQVGDTWTETHQLTISNNAERQTVHELIAGFYEPDSDYTLTASSTTTSSETTPIIARLVVTGEEKDFDGAYMLDNRVEMSRPSVSQEQDAIEICLSWQTEEELTRDYQVFIHLFDASNERLDQQDFQPRNYPSSVWAEGEVISDCRRFDETGEVAYAAIGMYDLETLLRLPLRTDDGDAIPNDQLIVELANP